MSSQFLVKNTNILQVFYVDYGNTECVDFDALFEWDPICNEMPFQAVFCRVSNVHTLPSSSAQEIYQYIHNNYLTKPCKAYVL